MGGSIGNACPLRHGHQARRRRRSASNGKDIRGLFVCTGRLKISLVVGEIMRIDIGTIVTVLGLTCTWFGKTCSCCSLPLLPQLARNIQATRYKVQVLFSGPVGDLF